MSKITALTANTSLAAGDLLVVVDVDDTTMAATGTDKKLAISDLQTFIKAGPASASATPANPTATASTSLKMMGLGSSCALTPGSSGTVLVTVTGEVTTATAVVTATWGGRYGTGAAPANGAAVSGTRFGAAADLSTQAQAAGAGVPFALTALLSLTPGTAYWFDIALDTANASDSASVTNISFTAVEIS